MASLYRHITPSKDTSDVLFPKCSTLCGTFILAISQVSLLQDPSKPFPCFLIKNMNSGHLQHICTLYFLIQLLRTSRHQCATHSSSRPNNMKDSVSYFHLLKGYRFWWLSWVNHARNRAKRPTDLNWLNMSSLCYGVFLLAYFLSPKTCMCYGKKSYMECCFGDCHNWPPPKAIVAKFLFFYYLLLTSRCLCMFFVSQANS